MLAVSSAEKSGFPLTLRAVCFGAADGTFSARVTLAFLDVNTVMANVVDPNGVAGKSSSVTYNLFKACMILIPRVKTSSVYQ